LRLTSARVEKAQLILILIRALQEQGLWLLLKPSRVQKQRNYFVIKAFVEGLEAQMGQVGQKVGHFLHCSEAESEVKHINFI